MKKATFFTLIIFLILFAGCSQKIDINADSIEETADAIESHVSENPIIEDTIENIFFDSENSLIIQIDNMENALLEYTAFDNSNSIIISIINFNKNNAQLTDEFYQVATQLNDIFIFGYNMKSPSSVEVVKIDEGYKMIFTATEEFKNNYGIISYPFEYNDDLANKEAVYKTLLAMDAIHQIKIEDQYYLFFNSFTEISELMKFIDELNLKNIEYNVITNHEISEKSDPYWDEKYDAMGYKSESGEIIYPPIYKFASNFTNENAVVNFKNKYGVINPKGVFKILPTYENIRWYFADKYIYLENGKYGIINIDEEKVLEAIYDEIYKYGEGYGIFRFKGNLGYLDENGKIAITAQFDTATMFTNGKAVVTIGGRTGTIDLDGNILWDQKIDTFDEVYLEKIDESEKDESLNEFITYFKQIIIDKDSEKLIDVIYDNIKFSFRLDSGKDSFIKYWKLDIDPENSKIWKELSDAIELGGVLQSEKQYIFPSIFVTFPSKYDPFTYGVIINQNTVVRKSTEKNSEIIKTVDNIIVMVLYYQPIKAESGNYIKIGLPDGTRGYVLENEVRAPIDYRGFFEKTNDTWKLTLFIAGD
ncbi:MAG: WG repeat-containing protein [Clostridiales bacterium]|nr:WG repeat-containing protein [Clostridiales bacterium]